MASSTSSLPQDDLARESPSLDTLISHLLAAKRALSCVEYVYRANDLVTMTRQALESHTIMTARTAFLRNGSISQVNVLAKVQVRKEELVTESNKQFESIVKRLDVADARLRKTLQTLRESTVDAKLRPEQEQGKHLIDFVDESGVDGLLGRIRDSVTVVSDARHDYEGSNRSMEDELSSIRKTLNTDVGKGDGSLHIASDLESPVPAILQDMEERVKIMAEDLESLVKHFDLCVTVIKHIEGGGAIARKVAGDLPDGVGQNLSEALLEPDAEDIGSEALEEMISIVEKDAGEVEDVVFGTRDHLYEMESQFDSITSHTNHLLHHYAEVSHAFHALEKVESQLPQYVGQGHTLAARWAEEKIKIEDLMDELEELRLFYDGFLCAYDSLIVEVGRRKAMEGHIEKILRDANRKVERLLEEEMAEREAFKVDQGDFLPVDIWPGLMTAPTRYRVQPLEEEIEVVPDISKSVIRAAIHRISGKSSVAG
ncbi:autophagy protein 17 [Agyrium rufum]|nr:autophagy protein 17 [Agyrium rufum]